MTQTQSVQVDVSDAAASKLSEIMQNEETEGKVLRIIVTGMGCSGPQLGLALDEPEAEPMIYQDKGLVIIGDENMKTMIDSFEGLTIDFVQDPNMGEGFTMRFNKPTGYESGGCGSCGSCGTC